MTTPNADDQRRQLRASFENLLQEQAELSADDRSFLLHHFNEALEQQNLDAPIELDPEVLRNDWAAAVDVLMPGVDASEREFQIRRFDDTLEPLRRDAVKDAVEYSRRRRDEGEEAAALWLNQRNSQRKASQVATPVANSDSRASSRKPAPRNPWGNGG
ncbi:MULTISPECIES: hypothetical protein [unclassified Lysobacter]|uniref:hypothetical protein n=1 Tax=unclassified Lysobacter TaxID=2635362 RepID=UPI001BE545C9|nr:MULTISPECIES: hypothetical protein [unclassified Lysobacter]MBT2749056.1 hypothetical protein [Lysobacter sp. ISL-42]MBT2754120.1 hypothetical protein [Lysobacter sp. ISL-50]MBT2779120.1 hypothetical protein [Lysobacter sp. ISL-54]MBT2784441.1 hypothetical protein [Lysobacter sp. ISL-52]